MLTIGQALHLAGHEGGAGARSAMMGDWLATSFADGFLAGYLGSFWSSMGRSDFFMMIAIARRARVWPAGGGAAGEPRAEGLNQPVTSVSLPFEELAQRRTQYHNCEVRSFDSRASIEPIDRSTM